MATYGQRWWENAVFYQIYPRSFYDSNGDGIGDLKGIIEKLDYLKDLGVNAIWLCPHYPSPFIDCGYDVSDYCSVGAEYGTLDDFKLLIDECHKRGIYIITDFVLNHTSDQHHWFAESRSSRDNPKRDWYVWKDGKDGSYPNEWQSNFDGPAWTYDEATGQYYYHFFLKEQPDLNWRNPEVKKAMFDTMRFWLDMGVDGFRIDAINTVYEHPEFINNTITRDEYDAYMDSPDRTMEERVQMWRDFMRHQVDQPENQQLLQEMREVVEEYEGDRVLVGEVDQMEYLGDGTNQLHMVFNFPLMRTDELNPTTIRQNQEERLAGHPEGSWPCNTFNNHDCSRLISRWKDRMPMDLLARIPAFLLFTLKGTPFIYYGDEIGMDDFLPYKMEHLKDYMAVRKYERMIADEGLDEKEAFNRAAAESRDKCRTPMQWEPSANAGFCAEAVEPWLPVNPNYNKGISVDSQCTDPSSVFYFYRKLIHARNKLQALKNGEYAQLHEDKDDYLAFLRTSKNGEQTCIVLINWSDEEAVIDRVNFDKVKCHFSSCQRGEGQIDSFEGFSLRPYEMYIGEVL
ncbi:MAG: alpha-glucosidase [Clostridia bacterium]|nr:alpha-glucosidase [Clostridia bacterium]